MPQQAYLNDCKKGSVNMHGIQQAINGGFALLLRADDLLPAEKVILRCYLNVTQSIAGCQAIRRRIGHCLFGFRVVAGECIFVTISPNRRWSQLIMRCSRIRPNDPMANADIRSDSGHVSHRARHADASSPGLFAELDDEVDLRHLFTEYDDLSAAERKRARRSVERAFLQLDMPTLTDKQAWNAEDPLASVHHYLFNMRVHQPLLYGIRMCLQCPFL